MDSPELRFIYDYAFELKMLPGDMLRRLTSKELTFIMAHCRVKSAEYERDQAHNKAQQ
jgi:hypothetical protein